MTHGLVALLIVLIVIVGSILTHRCEEFMIGGSLVGAAVLFKGSFLTQWCTMLQETISENVWIVVVCGLFGSLIALLQTAKGNYGFSKLVSKLCNSERKTLLTTFILGILIFVDDYLNVLSIGACMKGVYDKRKLFGVTTLDVLRSETFVSELKGLNVSRTSVPVIGGHSGVTILPLLSQVQYAEWKEEEIAPLTKRIQNAGTEVVEAKAGGGSATLSMAQAAARFARSLVKGLSGETVVECTYVEGDGKYARFFAQPVRLGKEGVEEILPIGTLSKFEQEALEAMLPTLRADIELGEKFING